MSSVRSEFIDVNIISSEGLEMVKNTLLLYVDMVCPYRYIIDRYLSRIEVYAQGVGDWKLYITFISMRYCALEIFWHKLNISIENVGFIKVNTISSEDLGVEKNTLLLYQGGIVRQKFSGANSKFPLRMWGC